jgi:hypothetical protein
MIEKGNKLHKKKKARKKKKDEVKHNRKTEKGENSRKIHIRRRERSYFLSSLSLSLDQERGGALFFFF